MKQELNYLHVVNPAEDKPTTKTLTPQLIGKGIIIDDILYQPLDISEESHWDKCQFCDCTAECDSNDDAAPYCVPFGEGIALQRQGKIDEIIIEASTDENKD